jgi:exopolysaccharide biosynthesis polyprenyl glycosylphosphotransferase
MLKENWRSIARIERLFDALIVILSFVGSYYGRGLLPIVSANLGFKNLGLSGELAPFSDYALLLGISVASYLSALQACGAYGSMRLSGFLRLFQMGVLSSILTFVSLATASFVLKLDPSRSFIGLHCATCCIGLQAERALVLRFLRYWRRKGRNFRSMVVVGFSQQARYLIHEINRRPELGIRVRGISCLQERSLEREAESRRFVGSLSEGASSTAESMIPAIFGVEELTRFMVEHPVDEVLFTDVVKCMTEVEEMVLRCSEQGIRTTLVADLFSAGIMKSEFSLFGTVPLIHYHTPPGDRWELTLKRLIDVVGSILLLLILSPLFLIIGLGILANSPGPILYKQKRVGLNGRLFSMYKFRSMVVGADAQLADLRSANEMEGPVFKLRDDPRVTSFGRWLRRYSLDELPQLWNVFRGDMSLVGPRPPRPDEVREYDRKDRRRLSMRPGLTCTWQVSGRNEISNFDSWVRLDLEYIDNWSLGLDLILLARTVPAVLLGIGAR